MSSVPHIPILRGGVEYESLDVVEVSGHRDGETRARVSRANSGLIRRDLLRMDAGSRRLREIPVARILEICAEAGERFLDGTLPVGGDEVQSPDDYVEASSATSGLPHALCRANMRKVHAALTSMGGILHGLMRGMDPAVIDRGFGEHDGVPVGYGPTTSALGVVLPSNSPGVNSIWLPAIALKTPVVLKPGREEPWTPMRVARAFLAAGCPAEAFGYYPTDHEGAAAILDGCGRALLFGDEGTTRAYASNPAIQIHGPGRSKVVFGSDQVDRWEEHLDVLVASVSDNGGRSCINASSIWAPAHADSIADALARRLAVIEPREPSDEKARLAAFPNPKVAELIDAQIEEGLAQGALDVTATYRAGPRARTVFGGSYLLPTIVRCSDPEHPLANTEFLFPFSSVVEAPQERILDSIGASLVVTAITRDEGFIAELMASPEIDRLNVGPVPTSRVEWDQPHEGNLFETLYARRAIQRDPDW